MHAKGPHKPSAAQPLRDQPPRGVVPRAAVAGVGVAGMSPERVLALQRSVGNAVVSRMIEESRHQHGAGCGHPQGAAVQRSAVHDVLRGGGQPLDQGTRTDMESRLGADFSDVRVHSDGAARASAAGMGARAYTSGSHVVIGEGGGDRHTLAHELVHVVQQRSGPVAGTPTADGLSVSDPSDSFEKAAEAQATRALSGPAPAQAAPGDAAHQHAGQDSGQVQRAPASADPSVQRLAINDSPSGWHGQPVRRSGEGAAGVFFVGPPGEEVVVKPLASTGNVEYAHKFLDHMRVAAPGLKRHAMDSPEGQALKTLLLNNAHVGRTPQEIPNQLATSNAFLVMEMLPGSTLQGAAEDEALRFLEDAVALHQTGRTMVADAFLGNQDRAVGMTVNLGNFLYQVANAVAPGRLHAIDNESTFTAPKTKTLSTGKKSLDDGLTGKLFYFDELRKPVNDKNYFVDKFVDKLKQSHREKPQVVEVLNDPARVSQIKGWIGEGITAAFADLANVFDDHAPLLRAIGSADYDAASAAGRNVSAGKAAAKYVKDTQGGAMTNAQAATELLSYVDQRVKKDKLPTGLKWAGALVP